ncbi:MAG: DoxX family membrane protein, partial [Bacteroidetes bacterium]|nr:DoxX family membrane protein [Bacteroidota bacterium]
MQNIINNQYIIAVFITRIFLGWLFFFQGYNTIVRIGIKNHIETLHLSLSEKGLSKALTITGVWILSLIQLIGGTLLILGFVKYYALYLLGLNLVAASIAYGIIKPMWDMQFVSIR